MDKKESYYAKLKRTNPTKFAIYKKKKYEYEKQYNADRPGYKNEYYHRTKTQPDYIKKNLWKNAKHRAKVKNLEFTITPDDIILPQLCPILGRKLDRNHRKYSFSLDRKDPNKGYTPDNIWVISQLANAMKWDSSPQDRKAFSKWVLAGEKGVSP